MCQQLRRLCSSRACARGTANSLQGLEERGYSIEVVRSRRAKRISLRITRQGSVRLTIPWWQPKGVALRWAESRHEWIVAALERVARREAQSPAHTPEEIEQLRKAAKEKLPRMLQAASLRTGLRYSRLTIRKTHTRWGSCTREGNISLSLFLAMLPDELIDYICVHELCHTVHHNHSAEFHALVNHHLGGREKELQKRLKNYQPR